MASGSSSSSKTELENNASRGDAKSESDVIQSEEMRISKIKKRFKEETKKLKLLENVAESRKGLIQYLSKKTEKEPETYKGSPLDEQEAESSNGLENETVKDQVNKIREPIDEFRAGVMYFKKGKEGKWRGEQCKDVDPSSGDFPNQKINMDTILSDTAKNRKLFERDEWSIKYFHFPANHMEWIEVSIRLLRGRSD